MKIDFRTRLLQSSMFAGAVMVVSATLPAIAQEADEPVVATESGAEDEVSRRETIVVTGSRIARPEVDTIFPTVSTDAALLEKGSFTNIADALNEIPAFGAGVSPQGDQGNNVGVNFVDFLDLGTQRTLTLVNGRRFVSQNSAGTGQQVDFNILPLALVERIDTIGVGGAPVYGSDAIAGTVNVILKDDFEGLEISSQYGETKFDDGEEFQFQVVAGANSADGRANVTFSAEYFDSQGLIQTDRPELYIGQPFYSESGERDINGDGEDDIFNELYFGGQNVQLFTNGGVISPSDLFIPTFGLGSFANDQFYQFAPNGNLIDLQPGAGIPGTSAFFAEGGFSNPFFPFVTQIRSPVERVVFASSFRYDFSDYVRATADAQFANSESIELVDQGGFQTFAFPGTSAALEVNANNPFFNAQARGVLTDLGYDTSSTSTDTLFLSRFNNDLIGNGSTGSESTTWRIAGGLEGDFTFADRAFQWDVSLNAGQFTNERFGGLINDRRFLLAVDAIALDQAAVDELVAAGQPNYTVGQAVCRTTFDYLTGTPAEQLAILQAQGLANGSGSLVDDAPVDITACQPLNLFGENAASREALEYVVNQSSFNNDVSQSVFTANFGGELFDLPAGPLAFNIGYETRRESANFQPSAGDQVGLGRGGEVPRTGGSYSTNELYGEILVPLLSEDMNLPIIKGAQIEASYREIDNSLAGKGEAYTIGGRITTIGGLTFRGNQTQSLRAPSLDELFSPVVTSFQFSDDPCDDRFINDRANYQANCIAEGVRTDANNDGIADGTFVSDVVNATAVGRAGGNPNLANETAEAYTIGLVYQPTFLENLTFTADYINIEISDLIQQFSLEEIMLTCYDAAPGNFPNAFCGNFTRDANGQIVDFLTGQVNADFSNNEFAQFDLTYFFAVEDALNLVGVDRSGNLGDVALDLNVFHVIKRDSAAAGVFSGSGQNGVGGFNDPRASATFDVTYDRDALRAFWRVLYQPSTLLSPSGNNLFVDQNGNQVTEGDARFIHNASISYDVGSLLPNFGGSLVAQIGIDNVFDRKAETPVELALERYGLAEVLGRSYTVRLKASF